MSSAILDAFLDGFTGAGFWEKLSPPGRPHQFKAVKIALTCGFVAAVSLLLGIVLLAKRHHDVWASVLCAALIFGALLRIVRPRSPNQW
jgi:FtsH-binding integral membrane protein